MTDISDFDVAAPLARRARRRGTGRRRIGKFRSERLKRAFDVALAGAALVLLAPLLAAIALAVMATSSGGPLFTQIREGRRHRPFLMLKFRTMYVETCDQRCDRLTRQADPRITPLGRILRRTSADELPQLVNVLRGEMSIVGPRPHPFGFHFEGTRFGEVLPEYARRHAVRPGLTGLAQVSGFRGTPDDLHSALEMIGRRTELDLSYVRGWSLLGDLKIILRTVGVLVRVRSY